MFNDTNGIPVNCAVGSPLCLHSRRISKDIVVEVQGE